MYSFFVDSNSNLAIQTSSKKGLIALVLLVVVGATVGGFYLFSGSGSMTPPSLEPKAKATQGFIKDAKSGFAQAAKSDEDCFNLVETQAKIYGEKPTTLNATATNKGQHYLYWDKATKATFKTMGCNTNPTKADKLFMATWDAAAEYFVTSPHDYYVKEKAGKILTKVIEMALWDTATLPQSGGFIFASPGNTESYGFKDGNTFASAEYGICDKGTPKDNGWHLFASETKDSKELFKLCADGEIEEFYTQTSVDPVKFEKVINDTTLKYSMVWVYKGDPVKKVEDKPKEETPKDNIYTNKLIQYPLEVESDVGTVKTIHLNVGETYSPSKNNFLRLDSADYAGRPVLTLWNKDEKGCRLATGWVNSNSSNGNYAYFLDQFMELTKKDATSIDAKLYTGNMAYEACNASSVKQKVRCLAFPKTGRFKIESPRFARFFDNKNEYGYNNLILNYLELGLTNIESVFPALKEAKPYGKRWKFPLITSKPMANSADGLTDTSVMIKFENDSEDIHQKIIDSPALLITYANKLLDGKLSAFEFTAELHELTHMFFYPTELGNFSVDGSDYLSEGNAQYVNSMGQYDTDTVDPFYSAWCGKDKLNNVGIPDLDGLTYSDAFITGKGRYEVGQCFFKRVEDGCGISAINKMIKSLLDRQYDPFGLYPNVFTLLKDSCSDSDKFNKIVNDFGFDENLLSKTNPVGVPAGVIKEPACVE